MVFYKYAVIVYVVRSFFRSGFIQLVNLTSSDFSPLHIKLGYENFDITRTFMLLILKKKRNNPVPFGKIS